VFADLHSILICTQIRLMRQMKEEQKKMKNQESKRMKEMMKLKRDFKMKEVGS